MSVIKKLIDSKSITPPTWLGKSMHYETLMGSNAYGTANADSDIDVYGFCIPPKSVIFPHLSGVISGFGNQGERFDQYQQAGVEVGEEKKIYDLQIYNIVSYFHLCMGCNPNMIDSLFTAEEDILYATDISRLVRSRRNIFLSKRAWVTFSGYAESQIKKMISKKPEGKRKALVEKYGYDTKFASHVIRLLDEAEQILKDGDINLKKEAVALTAIRNGEWTEEKVRDFFDKKMIRLEIAHAESKLQDRPNERVIKRLLLECLEEAYGCLSACKFASCAGGYWRN